MSMTMKKPAATWTFQHESAVDARGVHNVAPTDARGLRLRLQCGYTWMNQNDGRGWRQTKLVLREAERIDAMSQEASHG